MGGPLFVEPVFKERVWGGTTLREWYPDLIPPGTIGEAWAISGLPGDSSIVTEGPGAGGTLAEAWGDGRVTGRRESGDFPLLAKLLDPTDWLSVQVHPDDLEARQLEGQERGKAECWYVISAEPGAELILGHDLPDAAAMRASLAANALDQHLIREAVAPGAFFLVPAGCVHAVGPGQLIYEVQQSSDITYRLYDFGRPGLDGRPRELHLDKGLAVVRAFEPRATRTAGQPLAVAGGSIRALVSNEHFRVDEHRIDGTCELPPSETFRLATVLAGQGVLIACGEEHVLKRGASFVLPTGSDPVQVTGALMLIVSAPPA